MDNLISGLTLFFEPLSIMTLIIGIVLGVVIGAIPGLSTVMAIAIALPFTFSLPPVPAIMLLVGVYKGGMYGGSISAILINTPGTPAASCTMLDGYPLACKGNGKKALNAALYASIFGDMLANFALILSAAWLAKFALDFGAPEIFTLVVFSLTIVASVAGKSMIKGLLAAVLGLLMATIGTDLIVGTQRFSFDYTPLRSGLSLVPVLIGLFAIPEVVRSYYENSEDNNIKSTMGTAGLRLRELFVYWKTLLRGSFIGILLGIIPGLGATPAAFMSYGEARRKAKNPEEFGKGNVEGVVAAEVGNSSVGSATMIPLLALGIPGDLITAVMLGAFMIHGLQPGPLLFQDNINVIYALFIGLLVGSITLLIVGKSLMPILARVVNVPKRILLPSVLIFCIYGSYAINNSMTDIAVMLIMGIVGLVMLKLDYPRAPLLIAFVLGPLLENNFRQALLVSQGDFSIFLSSGICLFFWALSVISIVGTLLGRRKVEKAQLT
ncbi:tripartite tricarboxylate transporter permease [Halomonas litopenaei]|uniref:tripartite tricarboxylate transporter permease n=1 Tax=Halomonas litopenaei TaxID=2109328 RepID=UPI003FA11078